MPIFLFLLLCYSLIYYGGIYQHDQSMLAGYLIFFSFILYLFFYFFILNKSLDLKVVLFFYSILSVWTVLNSPHPQVDTIVVLSEAPIKFLQGINPYSSMFTRVYPGITPNYYNYLPLSFVFFLPFVLLFHDPRYGIIFCNILTAIFLYLLFKKREENNTLIIFISTVVLLPRSFYMLEHVYLDTVIFSFFVMFYYFLIKKKYAIASFILAFFLSFKQPALLSLPILLSTRLLRKMLLRLSNLVIFLIPFLLPIYYLVIDNKSFLNNILFNLNTSKITSPIASSLTLPTLIRSFTNIPLTFISFTGIVFIIFYGLILRSKINTVTKIAFVFLAFNYFFYHAFFNSYYFVAQFLLFGTMLQYFNSKKNAHS